MICVTCPYRETGCLEQQPDEAVAKFSNLLTRYSINGKGKTIFNQGELATGLYFLCNGMVKLTRVTEQVEEGRYSPPSSGSSKNWDRALRTYVQEIARSLQACRRYEATGRGQSASPNSAHRGFADGEVRKYSHRNSSLAPGARPVRANNS